MVSSRWANQERENLQTSRSHQQQVEVGTTGPSSHSTTASPRNLTPAVQLGLGIANPQSWVAIQHRLRKYCPRQRAECLTSSGRCVGLGTFASESPRQDLPTQRSYPERRFDEPREAGARNSSEACRDSLR